jgi:hypothetical protein
LGWGQGFGFLYGLRVDSAFCLFFVHYDDEIGFLLLNNREFDESSGGILAAYL